MYLCWSRHSSVHSSLLPSSQWSRWFHLGLLIGSGLSWEELGASDSSFLIVDSVFFSAFFSAWLVLWIAASKSPEASRDGQISRYRAQPGAWFPSWKASPRWGPLNSQSKTGSRARQTGDRRDPEAERFH